MSQDQMDTVNQETNIAVVIQTITDSISKEIEQLGKLYTMRDPERVLAFYAENRFLFDLLIEAPTQIRKRFGEDASLRLQMEIEPESRESRELFIAILTTLPATEAISLLDKIDEEWWLDSSVIADCKLNLILEFV